MRITFLGTGTSQGLPVIGCSCAACRSVNPHDKRLRCSLYIEVDDHHLVIDVGPDFRQQMLNHQIDRVDACLITHEHNDHTAGLDDIRPINFMTREHMKVYALPRVAHDLRRRFSYVFEVNPYPGAPRVDLREIETGFMFGDLPIEVIHYMHGPLPIIGYRIQNMAYLTDFSSIEESEMDKLQDLDVLVISALRREEHYSHLTLDQAQQFAKVVNAKRTYLIHMSHSLGPVEVWSQDLDEGVFAAHDGLKVEI